VRDAGAGLSSDCSLHLGRQETRLVPSFACALENISGKTAPTHWASKDLEAIDFDKSLLSLARDRDETSWKNTRYIKRTFEGLNPEQERKSLPSSTVRQRSCLFKHSRKPSEQGHFRCSTEGLKHYPKFFRKWFSKVIPVGDNKFSAKFSCVQLRFII